MAPIVEMHDLDRDPALKLPSRAFLRDHLSKAIAGAARDGLTTGVMCLRLRGLHKVEEGADEVFVQRLLGMICERLQASVRTSDIVARSGFDEFTVVAVRLRQPSNAYALARRLGRALTQPFTIDGTDTSLGVSIGIAVAETDDEDPECWLGQARLALGKASADGPDSYRCSNPELDAQMQVRLRLEAELRQALAEEQLALHYQPMVELSSRRVVGFEALLRWQHPSRGLLMPSDFLHVANESGLIIDLGSWMLHQACRDASSWPAEVKVATNFSLVEFRQRDMAGFVTDALADTGLEPDRLIIEISEDTLANIQANGLPVLHRLGSIGVSIAMDDFGTGRSSLAHLQSCPFDRIKIDQSLIAKIEAEQTAAAVVRAAISFCRSLGITVTAEGVETRGQLDFLQEEACDEVQGFYFSRPMPHHEVHRLIHLIEARSQRESLSVD